MWPISIVGAALLILTTGFAGREARALTRPAVSIWVRAPIIATLLWSPYAWLLVVRGVDEGYRLHWLQRWPFLPGLPAIVVGRLLASIGESAEWWLAGLTSAGAFGVALGISSIGRRTFIVVVALLLGYGVAMGFASHSLFWM